MPVLRELFGGAGFRDVATYVQSGNVVLTSDLEPSELELECERLIAGQFGFDVAVLARTRDELAAVVAADPFGSEASIPKHYQVTFLSAPLPDARVRELGELARGGERLVAIDRALYAWHPDGLARSKLGARLAGAGLGVKATARNWNTVTTLLEMAAG